jgi:glycine dehydrogenase
MTAQRKLAAEPATSFVDRHIGPSPRDIAAMLETIGANSLAGLMSETLPASIRQDAPLDLGRALNETEALVHMRELAAQNRPFISLIGQGYSGTILPAVIQRNILENPAWYTAYTPYQPEISQGRLEALFNYQTMICDLTGLDIANASLLDEATAAAEAMALAERSAKGKSKSFFVDRGVHPQTLAVLRTRAEPLGWTVIVGDPMADLDGADVFGALLQYPDTSGAVRDLRPAIASLRAKGALAIVAADLLALTLLASPGELGADVAIGSAQRFGVPMGYGGPHAAYMSVRDARTAYPPRKGHLQHLHRAGAAGGDRLDVCGLSRAGGTGRDRAHRASPHQRAGGRIAQARFHPGERCVLRYPDRGSRHPARSGRGAGARR